MSKHGAIQKELSNFSQMPEDDREFKGKNKDFLMKVLVHAADIGNPTRPFEIAKVWSESISREFFSQGDKEREFKYEFSMGCDRYTSNFAKG